ncbi:hypothetical protein LOAG_03205 [Loa loa]|uniref:Uncharacterized protein n=1 Tax=Loa loa TaxID=7209 RepID=A0A1S0U5G0_LOALO|nr:hypothetical protein LOAG_03205 [Loa loa]EFO25278.1 hypothetical protein LOAG_03205 [Loa loa]
MHIHFTAPNTGETSLKPTNELFWVNPGGNNTARSVLKSGTNAGVLLDDLQNRNIVIPGAPPRIFPPLRNLNDVSPKISFQTTQAHTHTNTYINTHICTYTCTYAYVHTYTQTHTHTRTHTRTQAQTQTQTHTHTHPYTYTYPDTDTYTHTHTHIQTHTHPIVSIIGDW